MRTVDRELVAVHQLGEAFLEFAEAIVEGVRAREWDAMSPAARAAILGPAPVFQRPDETPRLLTAKETAKYLSIGARKLWEMTAPRGPIPVVRMGKACRYAREDLDAMIWQLKDNPRKGAQC